MKVQFTENKLGILFEKKELAFALEFLKSIRNEVHVDDVHFNATLKKLHDHLHPPKVIQGFETMHLCEKCKRMMDTSKEAHITHTEKGNMSYQHQVCPPLKENRP